MEFNLTLEQKQEIMRDYGSSINSINTSVTILNALDIVEDYEEFLELVCSIALEVEIMKDMKHSTLRRKNLSEIIAAVLSFKYADLEDISKEKNQKVKVFIANSNNKKQ